ncbi:MAG: DUF1189 domain-containing protein [candidate division Zixibacteria bacterium]|nr:DUF1189 domain-containing protein [candidate division Zixibacteria bacterium]
MRKAWAFYLILAAIPAIPIAIVWGTLLTSQISDFFEFFEENIKSVEFVNGEIVNMPQSHHELQYKTWIIHVDTSYTDEESIRDDLESGSLPMLFIGSQRAFIIADETSKSVKAFSYPLTFSEIVDLEYFANQRTLFLFIVFGGGLLAAFAFNFIVGLIYALLVINPILLFKFRRMKLAFSAGFKASLYLVSFQILASSILFLLSINISWSFLLYIAFYIFYVGGFVNLDLSDYSSETKPEGRIS